MKQGSSVPLLSGMRPVAGRIHQGIPFLGLIGFDPNHPTISVGGLVDEFGVAVNVGIDFYNLPRNRHVKVGYRFDRFDGPKNLVLAKGPAQRIHFYKDNIS